MLSQLFKYGGIVAKTKAIKSRQLSDADFEALMQKTTLSEVVSFLKNNTHYADIFKNTNEENLHRGDIENPLRKYYSDVLKKYYSFMTGEGRKIIDVIFLREEIESIKYILRRLGGKNQPFIAPIDDFTAEHFKIDIKKLSGTKNVSEFMDVISGTEYEKILRPHLSASGGDGNKNMFALEMALDVYYTKVVCRMAEKFEKSERKIIKKIVGTRMDLTNIMWVYRCKKYYRVPREIIIVNMIPFKYKLTGKDIKDMAEASSVQELYEIIGKTAYGKLMEGLDDPEHKVFIESNYSKYYNKMLSEAEKKHPFSVVSVIAQINSVSDEIKKIVNIVEGIRYGLSPSEIRNMLV